MRVILAIVMVLILLIFIGCWDLTRTIRAGLPAAKEEKHATSRPDALSILVAAVAGFILARQLPLHRQGRTGSASSAPTIEAVQMLAVLLTTRVEVADVQETVIEGHTGGIRAVLLARGDFLLGVDLSTACFEVIDEVSRTAVLVLPSPTATSPRVDHVRSKIFALSATGLWLLVPGDAAQTAVVNRAFEQAQGCVAAAADDPKLIDNSRRQAEAVLGAFFRAMGWTVTIRWAS